jgi:presenilin-like A22 family membrane protease
MTKIKVLLSELLLFAAIQFLGIFVATKLMLNRPELLAVPEISLATFGTIFLVSVVFILLAMRFIKHKHGFKLLFVFLIVVGSKTVFSAFVSDMTANILALLVVALWVGLPYVFMHNAVLLLAVSGISTELGFSVSFSTILLLLAILSIYDVLAVYQTKHMVKMFTGLMDRGLLLSIVVPFKNKDWFAKTDTVRPRKGFLLLGTGDLAFPLIFAVTALSISLKASLFIALGSIVGAALVFYLLTHQTQRRAIPALPPIALCSILGFLASFLV